MFPLHSPGREADGKEDWNSIIDGVCSLIAVAGSLTLVLEDGTEETVTEPGSVIVQRGTLHRWENRSDGWVKFVAVMIDAKPVEIKDVEGNNTVETLLEGFNIQH